MSITYAHINNVQVADGLKPPVPSVVRATVPVGVEGLAPPASVTVAVHVVPCPTVTGDVQLTAVVVARLKLAVSD